MLTMRHVLDVVKEFQQIPGVGRSIAHDLIELGVSGVSELNGADPDALYNRLCRIRGKKIDRFILYVFRCAVYYASNTKHDAEKLSWAYWKD